MTPVNPSGGREGKRNMMKSLKGKMSEFFSSVFIGLSFTYVRRVIRSGTTIALCTHDIIFFFFSSDNCHETCQQNTTALASSVPREKKCDKI